jgi:hypothetical protein
MKKYCYVLVSSDGWEHWVRVVGCNIEGMETSDWDKEKLADLLHKGWRPVRETALGGGSNYSYALVLLEKE